MRFLIWSELFSQHFLALGFFPVKKNAVFSLGIGYGREFSEWARDGGSPRVSCMGWTGEQGRRQGEKVQRAQVLRADPHIS